MLKCYTVLGENTDQTEIEIVEIYILNQSQRYYNEEVIYI